MTDPVNVRLLVNHGKRNVMKWRRSMSALLVHERPPGGRSRSGAVFSDPNGHDRRSHDALFHPGGGLATRSGRGFVVARGHLAPHFAAGYLGAAHQLTQCALR